VEIYNNPSDRALEDILARPVQDIKSIKKIVKPILKNVKRKGDLALFKYALEYDHVQLEQLVVSEQEIAEAADSVDDSLKNAIEKAVANIKKFHNAQVHPELKVETIPGVTCYRKSVPIQKVGLYIPGGTAPLFSTVLMLGIPASIAGCEEIVLCTPPNKKGFIHPAILYAAQLVGINKVIKCGGAQAIGAMAYGTESVPAVYKIFGPGNQYVTAAKQIVSQKGVAIDMPAGPSEVAVLADDTAVPAFVAADLLSQAEHGVDSQVLLVSISKKIVDDTMKEIEKQLDDLPRKRIAEQSLSYSAAILVDNMDRALDIVNSYAAEHLILSVSDVDQIATRIVNAGSVFMGNYAPESAGDYASGTNHTLPTNKSALAYSGVSVDSFVKKITYQKLTEQGILNLGPAVERMAEAEDLIAHKNAIRVRMDAIKRGS